jgi:hypothetical protein
MSTELPFPVYLPNCQIIECRPFQEGYSLIAFATNKQANCPVCQQLSKRLHGFYFRQPTDLPISDKPVQLRLRLRRFRCLNPICPKRTFSQPCPDWLPVYARRTSRLAHAQQSVAMIRCCGSSGNGNRLSLRYLRLWESTTGRYEKPRPMVRF